LAEKAFELEAFSPPTNARVGFDLCYEICMGFTPHWQKDKKAKARLGG